MIPAQVNHIHVLGALALSLACAPAGNSRQGAETTTVVRAETVSVAAKPAPTDSNITRADLARIQGSASAPVWVIEVSDFQCPYCKQWHDESFAAIDREYVQTGKVRLAYLNFPLASIHKNARAAAEAAMCASVQGKFWPLHASLFGTQSRWAEAANPMPTFDSLAVAAGANPVAWRQCMTSHATGPIIDADRDRSSGAGVQSTPTFFVGDRKLEGAYPVDSFRVAIDAAIAKARAGK